MVEIIQDLIPRYGELNRIYRAWIESHAFSFEKQKMISDFYSEYNNITAFEKTILKLVLHVSQEQYILLLKSLKKEIRENIQLYETRRLPSNFVIEHVCDLHTDMYKEAIKEQMEETVKLHKPLNEANNRYDSIGYREHTAVEEKQAEREYERLKAEYDREKEKLDKLYDLQKEAGKEASRYFENRCEDIYLLSQHFMNILVKYVPDEENKQDEPQAKQEVREEQKEESKEKEEGQQSHEYFGMKLLSAIHEACVNEQFEAISEPDFYASMNLHTDKCRLKIKPREKVRVCYLLFLMSETLPKPDKDKWLKGIRDLLGIDESYYRSKYKEPVSDFPSDSNQKFAKEMAVLFR